MWRQKLTFLHVTNLRMCHSTWRFSLSNYHELNKVSYDQIRQIPPQKSLWNPVETKKWGTYFEKHCAFELKGLFSKKLFDNHTRLEFQNVRSGLSKRVGNKKEKVVYVSMHDECILIGSKIIQQFAATYVWMRTKQTLHFKHFSLWFTIHYFLQ